MTSDCVERANPQRVRILGVGSPFGDDAVGWAVVDALQNLPDLHAPPLSTGFATIERNKLDRPGPGLITHFADADWVILIDAINAPKAKPGDCRWLSLAEILSLEEATPWSSHGIGLQETLRLAQSIGALPPILHVLGIALDQTNDEALSEKVAKAVPNAAKNIVATLARSLQ